MSPRIERLSQAHGNEPVRLKTLLGALQALEDLVNAIKAHLPFSYVRGSGIWEAYKTACAMLEYADGQHEQPATSIISKIPVWTTDKPKAPGYYWVKAPGFSPRVLQFTMNAITRDIQPEDGPLSTEGWQGFSGPIYTPV